MSLFIYNNEKEVLTLQDNIINQVLDVEKTCEADLENAKLKAETMKSDAKVNSKSYYDKALRNAQDEYQTKIDQALLQAKHAVDEAVKSSQGSKARILENIKSKQNEAIELVIKELI